MIARRLCPWALLVGLLMLLAGAPFVHGDGNATASTDDRPYGSHSVTRFFIPGNADETPVLGIETPSGDLALYVVFRSSWGGIFATDGGADTPQLVLIPGTESLSDHTTHRVDVILHGATYTVTIHGKYSITAEALVPTTQGRPVLEPGTLLGGEQEVIQARARVDNANMAHETTFTREPELDGWTRFEIQGEIDSALESRTAFRLQSDYPGHQSLGYLELRDSTGPGLAYLHAPVPSSSRYVAEASYAPSLKPIPPRGQAVLAGVSGDLDAPVIAWAVVMDRPLDANTIADTVTLYPYAWTLYYQTSDGKRTPLMPYTLGHWLAVTAVVDENAGTLTIRIDAGAPHRPTFEHTFLAQDLGQVERIAVGDVRNDIVETLTHLPGRSWVGLYDDLAVYPDPTPPSEPHVTIGTTLVSLDEVGQHIVTHARVRDANAPPTAILAATDTNGDVLFYTYIAQNRLFTSDGQTDGIPNAALKFDRYIGSDWLRLDVLLKGDTYTLTVNGRDSMTARTFVHATEGSVIPDPRPLLGTAYGDAFWSRTRVDVGDGSLETTFADLTNMGAWKPYVTAGEILIHDQAAGHESRGFASIQQSRVTEAVGGRLEMVTYLAADLAGVGPIYGLEASFGIDPALPPLGDALLAGISGDPDAPTVHWALELDKPPLTHVTGLWGPTDRALYLAREDGTRTHLLNWHEFNEWHWAQVLVDESAGSLHVRFDGQDLGTFTDLPLSSATAIAVGDVNPGAPLLSDLWIRVDELAIYPLTGSATGP